MEKPKKNLDMFGGDDVRISSRAGEKDTRLMNGLRDIGKGMAKPGQVYLGSFATHLYAEESIVAVNKNLLWIHQQVGANEGEGLSASVKEFVASTAIADAAVNLRIHYDANYVHKTTDPRDKR